MRRLRLGSYSIRSSRWYAVLAALEVNNPVALFVATCGGEKFSAVVVSSAGECF